MNNAGWQAGADKYFFMIPEEDRVSEDRVGSE